MLWWLLHFYILCREPGIIKCVYVYIRVQDTNTLGIVCIYSSPSPTVLIITAHGNALYSFANFLQWHLAHWLPERPHPTLGNLSPLSPCFSSLLAIYYTIYPFIYTRRTFRISTSPIRRMTELLTKRSSNRPRRDHANSNGRIASAAGNYLLQRCAVEPGADVGQPLNFCIKLENT